MRNAIAVLSADGGDAGVGRVLDWGALEEALQRETKRRRSGRKRERSDKGRLNYALTQRYKQGEHGGAANRYCAVRPRNAFPARWL